MTQVVEVRPRFFQLQRFARSRPRILGLLFGQFPNDFVIAQQNDLSLPTELNRNNGSEIAASMSQLPPAPKGITRIQAKAAASHSALS
jgi:hypothetical protein